MKSNRLRCPLANEPSPRGGPRDRAADAGPGVVLEPGAVPRIEGRDGADQGLVARLQERERPDAGRAAAVQHLGHEAKARQDHRVEGLRVAAADAAEEPMSLSRAQARGLGKYRRNNEEHLSAASFGHGGGSRRYQWQYLPNPAEHWVLRATMAQQIPSNSLPAAMCWNLTRVVSLLPQRIMH